MSTPGYLYVLANSSMPELVKVGKTSRHPSLRAVELSGVTGVPTPFIVVYDQFFNDCNAAEEFVHALLSRKGIRVSEGREFFKAPVSEVVKAIMQAPGAAISDSAQDPNDLLCEDTQQPHELSDIQFASHETVEPWRDVFEEAEHHYYGLGDYLEDPDEALRLYHEAAKLGCLMAYRKIGNIYQYGAGSIQEDEQRALEVYKEGARKGNYHCYIDIAKMFLRDDNVDNYRKCLRLFFTAYQSNANPTLEKHEAFADLCYDYIWFCMLNDVDPLEEYVPLLRQKRVEIATTGETRLNRAFREDTRQDVIINHQASIEWINRILFAQARIERPEDRDGNVVPSEGKAEFKKNWDKIVTICSDGGTIAGNVKAVVKGGLLVDIGVEAFLPASQIDIVPPKNLNTYVGVTLDCKVISINQELQIAVLSRRELIEQEHNERRTKLLTEMMPGDIRKGTVKNITDFAAFIDLNGIDGLLHITDMSWGRIGHPSELLKVGQDIDVVVLDINKEKERVSLGLKQKLANPWDLIETKYPIGTKVKGKVVNLVPYGAFVELEPGVEGLVHVTELSWINRIAKPADVLKPDQQVEAIVLGVNREEQKITLSIRQIEANPWDRVEELCPIGKTVKGKIRKLTGYGAFVELESGLDGMIHISDISCCDKIDHPSKVLKEGEEVEAVVLEIDKDNQRIALGLN